MDDLTEENLALWEAELCYSGYSVAYHTLYPLYKNTHLDGFGFTDKQECEFVPKLRIMLRNKIIDIMKSIDVSQIN